MTTANTSTNPDRAHAGLHATSCSACGMVSAPVQAFGCESCGAYGDALTVVDLSGRGKLLAAVTVHRAPSPPVPSPYSVGIVQLDEGPVIRALLQGGPVPARGAVLIGAMDVIDGKEFVVFNEEEVAR